MLVLFYRSTKYPTPPAMLYHYKTEIRPKTEHLLDWICSIIALLQRRVQNHVCGLVKKKKTYSLLCSLLPRVMLLQS